MAPKTRTAATEQVRVRIDREQAFIYAKMLRDERYRLVVNRAQAKDLGNDTVVTARNRDIEAVSRMQEELRRAAAERGWRVG